MSETMLIMESASVHKENKLPKCPKGWDVKAVFALVAMSHQQAMRQTKKTSEGDLIVTETCPDKVSKIIEVWSKNYKENPMVFYTEEK